MTRLPERFLSKVSANPETGCWEWTASRNREGYGSYYCGKGFYGKAHRYAYEKLVGAIPEGLTLDHLCRNRGCVNPAHLEPVTLRVNILRGNAPAALQARQTICSKGHPFDQENTLIDSKGKRRCKACLIAYEAERNERRREITRGRAEAFHEALALLAAGRV